MVYGRMISMNENHIGSDFDDFLAEEGLWKKRKRSQ